MYFVNNLFFTNIVCKDLFYYKFDEFSEYGISTINF